MKLRQFSTSHVHVHNLHILNVYLNQTFLTLSLLKVPRHSNVTPGDHYMKLRNLTNYLLMLLSNIKPIFFNRRHPEIREQMSLCLVCICVGDCTTGVSLSQSACVAMLVILQVGKHCMPKCIISTTTLYDHIYLLHTCSSSMCLM